MYIQHIIARVPEMNQGLANYMKSFVDGMFIMVFSYEIALLPSPGTDGAMHVCFLK